MSPAKIDLVVSSCRPFPQDAEFAAMQRNAIRSWGAVAKRILLLNGAGEVDGACGVETVGGCSGGPPSLVQVVDAALENSSGTDKVAIINSDIILSVELVNILGRVNARKVDTLFAITSRRYEFDMADGSAAMMHARMEDWGLDVFIANRRVFELMRPAIPKALTLGKPLWDNWFAAWLNNNLPVGRFFDITSNRVVFHPKHSRDYSRHSLFTEEELSTINIQGCAMPRSKL